MIENGGNQALIVFSVVELIFPVGWPDLVRRSAQFRVWVSTGRECGDGRHLTSAQHNLQGWFRAHSAQWAGGGIFYFYLRPAGKEAMRTRERRYLELIIIWRPIFHIDIKLPLAPGPHWVGVRKQGIVEIWIMWGRGAGLNSKLSRLEFISEIWRYNNSAN